jgi:hypothetical protein
VKAKMTREQKKELKTLHERLALFLAKQTAGSQFIVLCDMRDALTAFGQPRDVFVSWLCALHEANGATR